MSQQIIDQRAFEEKATSGANKTPKVLPSLTGFRAIAAALVGFSHFGPPLLLGTDAVRILSRGYSGVTAFFILSGFVLTWSQLTKGHTKVPSRRKFMVDRLSRIYPLHIATLVLAVFLLGWPSDTFEKLGYHLLLLQAWHPNLDYVYTFNPVAWSLSVELFLYICFPFLFNAAHSFFRRFHAKAIGVIIAVGVAVPLFALILTTVYGANTKLVADSWSAHFFLYRLPFTRLGDFIVGIGMAFAVYYFKPISNRLAVSLQLFAVAAYICVANLDFAFNSFLGAASFDVLWLPVFGLAIYSLGASYRRGSRHLLGSPLLVALGAWSFAFYLLHYQLYLYSNLHGGQISFSGKTSWIVYVSGLFVLITALSWIAHRYIEQPAQRWIRKHTR